MDHTQSSQHAGAVRHPPFSKGVERRDASIPRSWARAFAAAAIAAAGGGAAAQGLRADFGAVLPLPDGAVVQTGGAGEPALWASRGGSIMGTGAQVGTTGAGAFGVLAERGGRVALDGSTVVTQGPFASALRADRGGQLDVRGSSASAAGAGAAAASLSRGGSLYVSGSTLAAAAGPGLRVRDAASFYLDNTAVSAQGASIASSLTRSGVQWLEAANGSRLVENDGTLLRVTRTGAGADGQVVLRLDGAQAKGDIVDGGPAASSQSAGTYVSVINGAHYEGGVHGIRSLHVVGATAQLTGGRIEQGEPVVGGDALHAEQGAQVTASGPLDIAVSGSGAPGEGPAVGVRADTGASIVLQGGSVSMTGASNARGVLATSGGAITLHGVSVTTQADGAHAAQAGAPGHPLADGTRVELDGATVRTAGAGAHGLYADQSDGLVTGSADVAVSGAGAMAALAANGGTVALHSGKLKAAGDGAAAAGATSGGTLRLGAVDVQSDRGDGIALADSAVLDVQGARVRAAGAGISSSLTQAGQHQSISIDAATQWMVSGPLLQVTRSGTGADGKVDAAWAAGAQVRGDLIDTGGASGPGGLYVTLGDGASYEGRTDGVRQFAATGNNRLSFQAGSTLGSLSVAAGGLAEGGTTAAPIRASGGVALNGARLAGNWDIGGTLSARSGAVIDPGQSLGRIRAKAIDWRGAQYRVELGDAGQADRVDVTGASAADLAGTKVAASALPGARVKLNRDYTVLTAQGGVTGRFAGLSWTGPSKLVKLLPVYGANHAALRLAVDRDAINRLPLTPNERETARGAESVAGKNDLVDEVFLNGDVSAFNQLSGEIHPTSRAMMVASASMLTGIAQQRMRANLGAGQAPGQPMAALQGPEWMEVQTASIQTVDVGAAPDASALPSSSALPVWTQFVAGRQTLGSDGNAAQAVQSLHGFFLGGDAGLGGGWRLGAAVGYTDGTVKVRDRDSRADIETYSVAVYGGKAWDAGRGRLSLLLGAGHAWHDLDVTRNVSLGGGQRLTSSYDGKTAQAFVEAGYALPVGERVAVEPFAGAAWLRQKTDGFRERGGDAALRGDSERADVKTFTLGLRTAATFEVNGSRATLRASLGWRHASGDTRPRTTMAFIQGNGAAFEIAGAPVADDAAVFGLGGEVALGKNAALGVGYNGQVGDGNREHMGGVYLKVRF